MTNAEFNAAFARMIVIDKGVDLIRQIEAFSATMISYGFLPCGVMKATAFVNRAINSVAEHKDEKAA